MAETAKIKIKRMITPPGYAAEIGVSPQKVLDWIASGELPAMNAAQDPYGGRPRYLIDRADIVVFEQRRAAPCQGGQRVIGTRTHYTPSELEQALSERAAQTQSETKEATSA